MIKALADPAYLPASLCDPLGPLVLGALCLPYVIRFVQCLRVNHSTGSTAQVRQHCKVCWSIGI